MKSTALDATQHPRRHLQCSQWTGAVCQCHRPGPSRTQCAVRAEFLHEYLYGVSYREGVCIAYTGIPPHSHTPSPCV